MSADIIGKEFEYLGLRCRVAAWVKRDLIRFESCPSDSLQIVPLPLKVPESISLSFVSNGDLLTRYYEEEFAADIRKCFVNQLKEREA